MKAMFYELLLLTCKRSIGVWWQRLPLIVCSVPAVASCAGALGGRTSSVCSYVCWHCCWLPVNRLGCGRVHAVDLCSRAAALPGSPGVWGWA